MVMIFSSRKALEQLRIAGEVVTFRLKERKVSLKQHNFMANYR